MPMVAGASNLVRKRNGNPQAIGLKVKVHEPLPAALLASS